VLCLAGSLVAHVLGYGWLASMAAPPARKVPSGFIMVEQWPVVRPVAPPPDAGKPGGAPPAAGAARTRSADRTAPSPVNVASEVQRKGILRAFGTIGREPMARGIPGSLGVGDLAAGQPDAPRSHLDPAAMPGRREGGGTAPAVLGDLGTGGRGAGGLGVAGLGSGGLGGVGGGGGAAVGIGEGQVGSTEVDQAKLDSYVRARIGGLRACYETQLKLDQRRDGTVRMRFAILPSGEVADVVATQNTLGSAVMADCLLRIVRAWRTPFRPSQAVSVEYPFVFRPSGE